MGKDPAFLFYTNDFISGIADLTMEERGQYITLLCLQHQKGHLSDKIIKLSLGNAAADVMAKFRQDAAGLWYNARLEFEIEKRKSHSKKQSDRALKGWEKRKKKDLSKLDTTADAPALPLEDRDENENTSEVFNNKDRIENYLISCFRWKESVVRNLQTKGHSPSLDDIDNLIKCFCIELEATEDVYKSDRENKSHFTRWSNIQLKHNKQNGSTKKSRIEDITEHNAAEATKVFESIKDQKQRGDSTF